MDLQNNYEMCNKKSLTKNFEKMVLKKSTGQFKENKTFKSYLFLYSICFHSYTHQSNFRYDLILMVNDIKTFGKVIFMQKTSLLF